MSNLPIKHNELLNKSYHEREILTEKNYKLVKEEFNLLYKQPTRLIKDEKSNYKSIKFKLNQYINQKADYKNLTDYNNQLHLILYYKMVPDSEIQIQLET